METEGDRPESSCWGDCVRENSKKFECPRLEFPSCEVRGLNVDCCEGRSEGLTKLGLRTLGKDGLGVVKKEGREVVTKAG